MPCERNFFFKHNDDTLTIFYLFYIDRRNKNELLLNRKELHDSYCIPKCMINY